MKKKILIIFMLTAILLSGCASNKSSTDQAKPIKTTEFVLGTIVDIIVYDEKDVKAVNKVFTRLRDIESLMTINKEESELQSLNNSGELGVTLSDDTLTVLKRAVYYAEISNGLFDPTIGPLIKIWNIGSDNARVPLEDEINQALNLIDYRDIKFDDNNVVSLSKPGMIVDLGSIAKGYAADEAVSLLKDNGVTKAIVNLGGNIYALGNKSDGVPWKIGIQDPNNDRGEYLGSVNIANQTVVTSGIYERFFEQDGIRYHHILNPKTGYPMDNELASVTIVSDSSIDADALSTTLFVLGYEKGMKLVETIPNSDAVFVTKDKKIYVSSGLKENFKRN